MSKSQFIGSIDAGTCRVMLHFVVNKMQNISFRKHFLLSPPGVLLGVCFMHDVGNVMIALATDEAKSWETEAECKTHNLDE